MSHVKVALNPVKPSPLQAVKGLSEALRHLGITLDFEPLFTLELKRWAHCFDLTIELTNSKHELRTVSKDDAYFLLDSLFTDADFLLANAAVEVVRVRLTKQPPGHTGCVEVYFNALPKHDYKAVLYSFSFLKPGTPVMLSELIKTSEPPIIAPDARFCQYATYPNIL